MTRTLDLNDETHDSRLVLQGRFRPEGPWEVRVSRSVGAFEPGRVRDERFAITDASIEVFRGDQRLGVITRDSLNRYTSDVFTPRPEETYTVHVSAPGLDPVEATDRVPALPPSRLAVDEEASQEEERRTLRLTIEDPSTVQNYYRIVLHRVSVTDGGTTVREQQFFRTQNQAILEELGEFELEDESTYNGSAAIFTDVLFDGQTYTIDLEVQDRARGPRDQPRDSHTYELQVQALSSATYTYLHNRRLASETEDNPFASPVDVDGNVEGGYGLMGAIHVDTLRQEIE